MRKALPVVRAKRVRLGPAQAADRVRYLLRVSLMRVRGVNACSGESAGSGEADGGLAIEMVERVDREVVLEKLDADEADIGEAVEVKVGSDHAADAIVVL